MPRESRGFTVIAPHQLRVTKASYGYLRDEHAYLVEIKVRMGRRIPAELECPANMYHERYNYKHEVLLAPIDSSTVLNASVAYVTPTTETDAKETVNIAANKLQADGVVPAEEKVMWFRKE